MREMMKMKELFIYMLMTAWICTACQNNDCEQSDLPGNEQQENIERVPVAVGISIGDYSTYSTIEESPKNGMEIGTISDVDIYIFSENGRFYEHMNIPLTQNGSYYESNNVEFPKGNWYMYAFIHKPANFFQEPTPGTTIGDFERQRVTIGTIRNDWITRDLLIMGTLVRELKTITGQGNPEIIHLKVGHLMSKVEVAEGVPATAGDLKGRFRNRPQTNGAENPLTTYAISCEPTGIFLVGQWEGEYMGSSGQVISPHYESYDTTAHFRSPLYPYPKLGTGFWYTVENTNKIPNTENTICFVVEYQYLPDLAEIHLLNHQTGGTLTGNTFYIAEFSNGSRLIYASDPSGLDHPTLGLVRHVRMYKNGYCYYRIPVEDTSKATNTLRYSTIRNHYYVLTVHSVSRIGNDNWHDWGEWELPWEDEAIIDANLEVLDWNNYEIPVNLE